jgi:hypothetical protein
LLISPYAQMLAVGSHAAFAFLTLLLWFGALYRRYQIEGSSPAGWLAKPGSLFARRMDAL